MKSILKTTKLNRNCKNHSVVVKFFSVKIFKINFFIQNSISSPWIFLTVEEWNPFTSSVYLNCPSRAMISIEWYVGVKFRFENIKYIYVTSCDENCNMRLQQN